MRPSFLSFNFVVTRKKKVMKENHDHNGIYRVKKPNTICTTHSFNSFSKNTERITTKPGTQHPISLDHRRSHINNFEKFSQVRDPDS